MWVTYWQDFQKLRESSPIFNTLIFTIALCLFFLVVRFVIHSQISKKKNLKADKILFKKKTNQYLTYLFLLSILFLWFHQLQVFFVSLLAVAAAIVIALKELIMCFTGGTLIRVSKIFKEGDRIEVDGKRGFVIDKSLLSTKLLEIGPEMNSQQTTGDIITIPNSVMLSHTIKNESYFKGYSIKSFTYKIFNSHLAAEFEKDLLLKAKEIASPYLEDAKKSISKFCEKEGLVIPGLEPRTKVLIDEDEYDILLLVKLPVQNHHIAELEQELNRFYLNWRIKTGDQNPD